MTFIVRVFSLSEKQSTKTDLNVSLAFKLTIMRFLNTSVIYMLVHTNASRWYQSGDLVSDVFSVLVFAVGAPVIALVCYWGFDLYREYQICSAKGADKPINQMQANELMEG